jgi:hypothetical protein
VQTHLIVSLAASEHRIRQRKALGFFLEGGGLAGGKGHLGQSLIPLAPTRLRILAWQGF